MLKVRIVPTLLWKNDSLVKGTSFNSWRRVGALLPAVKVYNLREVDELIVLDIAATLQKRDPDFEAVAEFSQECFVPLTVGGGIRTVEHVRQLLLAGADKVSINSAGFESPDLVRRVADQFGSQCVIVSIDVRTRPDGNYECYSHCGTQPTGEDPVAWAKQMEQGGAGELLLGSIERDGTMQGYDLELLRRVSDAVSIPVIASGGAGNFQHLFEAMTLGKASAVAASSMFLFTQQTPLAAKLSLALRGIAVRNQNTLVNTQTAEARLETE
jgi:cyclase